MMGPDVVRSMISKTLRATDFPQLGTMQKGKVRDSYVQGNRRYIVATDRISAFDVVLGTVPFKGQILNQMASYWFEQTKDIAPNHVLDVPDPAVTVAKDCRPLPLEMVVRAYLTGSSSTSIWRAYERGDRVFCGHDLPDGMSRHQRLDRPLVTPSTKAEIGEHDRSVSRAEVLAMGLVTEQQFDEMADYAMALFALGQRIAAERGLILVDTKYEFGLEGSGRILLIDEIHTPDSSRYWYLDSYEGDFSAGRNPRALDKEFVRRYLRDELGYSGQGEPPVLPDDLVVEAAMRYAGLFEEVTGRPFDPNKEDPETRIRRNLGLTA
ncbi:MAG: phosphoribosylaminoimidazolesuccinocarboxamide synthase [Deltaproteobacteria bacterium]|nr:phosphoribosylaminoimidazolesuccinocarboxamide synthase [Deltaproteobacteria bacterium]